MIARGGAQSTQISAQIPCKLAARPARSATAERDYLAVMASSAMREYIARVAREARESAGRKPYNIASAPPGMKGADPSTVWRFENEEGWPRDTDHMIALYAADLDLEPIDLWQRALDLWRSEEDGTTAVATNPPAPPGVGPALAPLLEEAESQQLPAHDQSTTSSRARRPKSA